MATLAGSWTSVGRVAQAPRQQLKTRAVLFWMLVTIVAVAAIAYWDEQREFAATLSDFAKEQAVLAQTLSATLQARLRGSDAPIANGAPPANVMGAAAFLAAVASVERPHRVRVLVQPPGTTGLLTAAGAVLRSPAIEAGLSSDASWLRLGRSEAAALGLPARAAMVGLSRVPTEGQGNWSIAVVATAERERDREVFAQWRLVLSVVLASGLVLAFGGLALRNQRKQLELAHQLAVASVQSERDDRLVRADKLATMGALATGIAHEVSTPLGVIVGRAEQLLARCNGDERATRAVEAIAQQADRIGGIVRGFLALARGDSPRTETVDPKALAEVALELVEHRFLKAQVGLTRNIAARLPRVACEPRLIEQVLVNLLLNACDACGPGGSVELCLIAEGESVAFVVTDDGVGISADASARILEPFFTTKPLGQGSGLGLAITNELVKHHRGNLKVAARQGQRGTRACVELPAMPEPTDA